MLIAGTDSRVLVVAGVAAGLVVLYLGYQAKKNAGKIADAVNPLSINNAVYRGVNSVGEAITGDSEFSLGVWAWEVLNPGKVAAERRALNTNPEKSQGLETPWQEPSSPFMVGA